MSEYSAHTLACDYVHVQDARAWAESQQQQQQQQQQQ